MEIKISIAAYAQRRFSNDFLCTSSIEEASAFSTPLIQFKLLVFRVPASTSDSQVSRLLDLHHRLLPGMVYITQWDEFAVSSERLFLAAPLKTRLSFKYRATDGAFELKVTDDRTCLKYKSNQKSDIRKMEALNMRLLDLMTTQESPIDAQPDPAQAASQ